MGWSTKTALWALAFLGIGSLVYYLYKREGDDEEEEEYERFTTVKSRVLEIKVPKEHVGAIVGRGGIKLKEMEALTDTSIHFREFRDSDKYKLCVIRGKEESVNLVEQLIYEAIRSQPVTESFAMYVPFRACSRIIGKNGENIRSISRTSHAHITVENSMMTRELGEQKIIIKGTTEQIELAKRLIEQKVDEDNLFRNFMESTSSNRSPRKPKHSPGDGPKRESHTMVTEREVLTANRGDGLLEVFVSAISDPDKFWVQMIGPSTAALDKLNEQMNEYYSQEENRRLHILKDISVDQIVAAQFCNDKKWYRAEITSIRVNERNDLDSELELYFVDYGDTSSCLKREAFELRADFLRLRIQAIECILAKVKPREYWCEDSVDLFEMLTHTGLWKSLTAKIHGYRERPKRGKKDGVLVPCVELFDCQCRNLIVNVAEEMVKNGYAVWVEDNREEKETPLETSRRRYY